MSDDMVAVIPGPRDWPVRSMRDLTSSLRRGTAPVYVDVSPVAAIGQRCITAYGFDASRARPHAEGAMRRVLIATSGDVLINSTGTGTIGRSAVFRESEGTYIVDGHVTLARPIPSEATSRWLNESIRSPEGQRYMETRGYSGSTNQVELSATALAAMPVATPEIHEQQRVAALLAEVDSEIDCSRQTVDKLDQLHRGLREQLIGRMEANRFLREALKGRPVNGIYKPAALIGRGTLLIGQTAITVDRRVDPRVARRAVTSPSERDRFGLSPDDILVSRVFGTLEGVGQPALVCELTEEAVFESNMMRLRVSASKAVPYFVFQCLLTAAARSRVTGLANLSNQASIGQDVLLGLPTWLPSLEEQRRVSTILDSAEARIRLEKQVLRKLEQKRSGMLADLLSGRVRVPVETTT